MSTASAKVIVLGGGTMGTAAAWALEKQGADVIVFEQFDHIHTLGSHGGQTRIFRHAYSEGAAYVPLMLRADDLWCEVEAELGIPIVHRVGILEMDGPLGSHARNARAAGMEHGIDYEWLDADEIHRRWPAFSPPPDWQGGYSDRAGFLEVEPGLAGMRLLAERLGARFVVQDPVLDWTADGDGVSVRTANETYRADRLVITGGAWNGGVLKSLELPLQVVRKVLFWLDVEAPDLFREDRFPVFAAADGATEIYGFPLFGKPGLKVADHHGGENTTPETLDRSVAPSESTPVATGARAVLPTVTDRVVSSAVCMYTRTPDEHFIIDRHPDHPKVVFGAGFSGHGFKFAPRIGELLSDLALTEAEPMPLFAMNRFTAGG